jgi:hypothetical protein
MGGVDRPEGFQAGALASNWHGFVNRPFERVAVFLRGH